MIIETKYEFNQKVWVKLPHHHRYSIKTQIDLWSEAVIKGYSKYNQETDNKEDEYLVDAEDGSGWIKESEIRTTEPEKDEIEKFLLTIPELDREDRLWVRGCVQEKIQEKQKRNQ